MKLHGSTQKIFLKILRKIPNESQKGFARESLEEFLKELSIKSFEIKILRNLEIAGKLQG